MTAAELAVAQGNDREAKTQLAADLLVLSAEMPDEFPVGDFSPWLERIDDLRYRCVAVGGDVRQLAMALDELRATSIKALRTLVETNQDALPLLTSHMSMDHLGFRRILPEEREVSPGTVVITCIASHDPPRGLVAQDDHRVRTFPGKGTPTLAASGVRRAHAFGQPVEGQREVAEVRSGWAREEIAHDRRVHRRGSGTVQKIGEPCFSEISGSDARGCRSA